MSTTIVLVRHGETDWNRERRLQGHADPPLNEKGRRQARDLAERLSAETFAAVWSSDLRRAHETAEIVAAPLGMGVATRADLREADVGRFTGLTIEEIGERFPDALQLAEQVGFTGASSDGESWKALADRVLRSLQEIAAEHDEQAVLVVTHGGPIRATLAHADGMTVADHRLHYPAAENGSLVRIAVRDGMLERVD